MPGANPIVAACEAEWEAHKADCSGFLKAVAHRLGIELTGQANDIIATLRTSWPRAMDGASAAALAAGGQLVVGGLEAAGHGHVVVVVPGPLEHGKYPHAYWGRLNAVGAKDTGVNFSWNQTDRDRVGYWHSGLPTA